MQIIDMIAIISGIIAALTGSLLLVWCFNDGERNEHKSGRAEKEAR